MDVRTEGPGPYSKSAMRLLGGATALFAVLSLVWGGILAADDDSRGVKLMILGGVLVIVAAVGIPLGLRRGRM
ncbi:hypothetical protein ACIA8K_15945 [Catenuloplanes sp. NPDC051500]|uniref:hypothetical protein n=1 Tax=Catenuloplanes sp. NPDC051500 TaxID=3363959 RepID=UPI0037A0A32C